MERDTTIAIIMVVVFLVLFVLACVGARRVIQQSPGSIRSLRPWRKQSKAVPSHLDGNPSSMIELKADQELLKWYGPFNPTKHPPEINGAWVRLEEAVAEKLKK